MGTDLYVRPLGPWPWPVTTEPERTRFSATWSDTMGLLDRELSQLGVGRAALEIDVPERGIRVDGNIKANARPASDRVVLSFTHPEVGSLRYPCDRFTSNTAWVYVNMVDPTTMQARKKGTQRRVEGWQANVRAIALALEALRKIDRYGVVKRAEQYAGWRALPAQAGTTMTATRAAEIVGRYGNGDTRSVLTDPAVARRLVLLALKTTHPDRGGQGAAFNDVQIARQVLADHHGVTL